MVSKTVVHNCISTRLALKKFFQGMHHTASFLAYVI